ncbi:MAG: 1-deoxy-D-xylulose-5-phosphate reductoisomerase, partial [Oscillospiraceae bacterium]|nr:1-deoxy-D-xylulose-5-phosphate reductoisomerase [Oscillospiraceae bacterium]
KILCGKKGLSEIASLSYCDVVLNSVVGIAGLSSTLEAIKAGKVLALANKESLVTGGALVMNEARKNNVSILPVDSEHSAIFQCLQGRADNKINKIILTASGGPFFGKDKAYLETVSVEDALRHPNWSMGSKITIDSATMMNKGLELIEAVWLFDVKPSDVEIVVHRESVIHSAVEFDDYSVIAQLGVPDMKIPIQYALTYPHREKCAVKRLSLTDYKNLSFFKPDYENFTCLSACKQAIEIGGLAPCAANGANEAAVSAFLSGKISFNKIGELVQNAVSNTKNVQNYTIDDVWETDRVAREMVLSAI